MKAHFSSIDYFVMAAYLVITIALGLYFSRKEDSTEDYFLGGRKMPILVISVSMFVTLFSAISFVSIPGEAFQHGLSMAMPALLTPIGTLFGFSLFVKFYFKSKSFTPFQYLGLRYDMSVRIFISIIYIAMRLLYLGVVMYASAKAFKGASGWPIWMTIMIIGAVGIFYTTLGGMKAVVWTDFLQFGMLAFGIGFVFYKLAVGVDGGIAEVFRYAFENNRGFEAQKSADFFSFDPHERYTLWLMLISLIAINTFNYGADQMTIQRLLSTKSYKHARNATIINVMISTPMIMVFWVIGLGLFYFYSHNRLPEGVHPNEVFSYFMVNELPAPVPGILMAALLAAVMSTLDSGINSLSAVFVNDIYKSTIRPAASSKDELRVSKIFTIIWGVTFVVFGLVISNLNESVTTSILEVAGIWGALFGIAAGTFMLGVINKRTHSGVIYISSIISLAALVIIAYFFYYRCEPEDRISFNIIGSLPFMTMLLVGFPLSLVWPRGRDKKSLDGLTLWTYRKESVI